MKWSEQQERVFKWTAAYADAGERGALIVEAVAGSGKTTTIVEAAKFIPKDETAVFCAFNKSIAEELKKRLPEHVEARTLNGMGHRAVMKRFGRVELSTYKTRDLIRDRLPEEAQGFISEIANLVAKAKAHGMVPDGMPDVKGLYKATFERWATLMDRYQIDADCEMDDLFDWAEKVLRYGLEETHVIDFDDQLYLTVAYNLPCFRYDWIIVDEAQDVSHVQRAMLRKHLKESGKLIAVGDSRQAIYGFRGADSESLDNIARDFSAERLPLSVTYRCPRAVVELAQQYCPEISCPDTAPAGTVKHLEKLQVRELQESDMVLCRNWAPLITAAYRMIGQQVPVYVAGRDIGQGLISLVKKLAGKTIKDIPAFEEKLGQWAEKESEKARQRGQDNMLDVIADKHASLLAVIDATEPGSVSELMSEIASLFESGRGATLSTVHRAKGLEAHRVFILEPGLMPSKYARQDWQMEQERNLMYVAYTRALSELYFINLEGLD